MGLSALLQDTADVINRHEIPRLWRLNGWDPRTRPTLTVTPHVDVNVPELIEAVVGLARSGAPLWPNPDLARKLSELTGLPIPEEMDDEDDLFEDDEPEPVFEIPPGG